MYRDLSESHLRRKVGLFLGPALFLLLLAFPEPEGMRPEAWKVAAVGVLMMTWWITEAVSLAVTAFIPLVAFPLLGIITVKQAAIPYASPVIYLFFGGFMLATAMEKWNLHKRIAYGIVLRAGKGADSLIGGFMLATAVLSMWISNTATVLMMLPICLSVVTVLTREDHGLHKQDASHFSTALMLGLAYAASIGGVATIIGTPPNAIFVGFMHEVYGIEISFLDWMVVALPITAAMLLISWFYLVKVAFRNNLGRLTSSTHVIERELSELGKLGVPEKLVALVFVLTATMWVIRGYVDNLIPSIKLNDASIAMFGALLLFIIPADRKMSESLLSWRDTSKMPWGVLVLFGGGLSLAAAIRYTGLAGWLGEQMAMLGDVSEIELIIIVAIVMILLTEVMSNIATISTFLPVIGAVAAGFGVDPLLLLIPATIVVSYAFMMPVSTAPNAIVYASGYVSIPQMMKTGFLLNIVAVMVVTAICYGLIGYMLSPEVDLIPLLPTPAPM